MKKVRPNIRKGKATRKKLRNRGGLTGKHFGALFTPTGSNVEEAENLLHDVFMKNLPSYLKEELKKYVHHSE